MKKVLIVIDMQNDFITGSLGTKEAVEIVENVEKKIQQYLNSNDIILFTRDTHGNDYLNTNEGKRLPVEHCIKGTDGWEITPRLRKYAKFIFDKPTFSSLELAKYIEENEFTHVELIGLCTDICVISNALLIKAHVPERQITVDSSCCAGVTNESHLTALDAMRMCQIDIT